jgi:NAD(P)-dependent dehydrogenase (short-subunit alcohol dehydrogenase family)
MFDFRGKVVLITGATQGFGRVCAEQGARLALCVINDDGGAETLLPIEAAGAQGHHAHARVSNESEEARFGLGGVLVIDGGFTVQ